MLNLLPLLPLEAPLTLLLADSYPEVTSFDSASSMAVLFASSVGIGTSTASVFFAELTRALLTEEARERYDALGEKPSLGDLAEPRALCTDFSSAPLVNKLCDGRFVIFDNLF